MSRRHPHVVNLSEIEPVPGPVSGSFRSTMRPLAGSAGGRSLGATHYEIEPGAAAFPHHWHTANEEALFVLEGTGALRIGPDEVPVGPGDWVSLPVGPGNAHQLRNTGSTVLKYVCISTMNSPEVCGYPDSRKLGTIWRDQGKPVLRAVFYEEEQRGYFDREPGSESGS